MSSDLNTNIDYDAVLADLKDKRAKLDAAISGIEMMLGLRPPPESVPEALSRMSQGVVESGAFLGMTIVDAAVKLLKSQRRNMRTDEVLNALRAGGLTMASTNPINTVGSLLLRDWQSGGEIVRVDRGVWGLLEWHRGLRYKGPESKASSNNGAASATDDLDARIEEFTKANEPKAGDPA